MKYEHVREGKFIERPNRFVARVLLDGREEICHVKNTGRCRELLTPGARVILSLGVGAARKTKWDLIAVWKGDMLINMDSQAPNKVFAEWAQSGIPGLKHLKPEAQKGNSRFDFYFETETSRGYIEVKGVTLENDGVARFPDAPTARGARHVRELMQCRAEGLEAWVAFVVQMPGMKRMEPNWDTDPEFSRALVEAKAAGVHVVALGCHVEEDALEIAEKVPVCL